MWRKLIDLLFWLAAALHFGGLVTLGAIAAPAIFRTTKDAGIVLPGIATPPLPGDSQAGGEIFGAIFQRYAYVEFAALGILLICILAWLFTTRFRTSTGVLAALWAITAALVIYDAAILTPRVWEVRTTVRKEAPAHAAEGMDAMWPARLEFDKLHKRSESLGKARVYALLGMIVIAAWRGTPYRGRPGGAMLNEAMRSKHGK